MRKWIDDELKDKMFVVTDEHGKADILYGTGRGCHVMDYETMGDHVQALSDDQPFTVYVLDEMEA